MRKILIFFTCIVILTSLFSCEKINTPSDGTTSPEADTEVPVIIESPASDFIYQLSPEGDQIYINKYIGSAEDVVIPAEIEGLPVTVLYGGTRDDGFINGAFEGAEIKSVSIPEGVIAIATSTFKDCKNLVTVALPNSLEKIGYNVFMNCSKIQLLDFSKTKLTEVSGKCFAGCTELLNVYLPESVTHIEYRAFYQCSSLKSLKLPSNLTKMESYAIEDCASLSTITIPAKLNLSFIDGVCIYKVPKLEEIIFDEGRERIEGYAFINITSNPVIQIPESVKTFSPYVFFTHGDVTFVFEGDCPECDADAAFYGNPTIHYDSTKNGWNDCTWQGQYPMIPLK